MNQLWMDLLSAMVQIVLLTAGGYAVRWLRARYTADQLQEAERVATIAVNAVEQIFLGRQGAGRAKFAQAKRRAQEILGQAGIQLTDQQIDTLIERAVWRLNELRVELTRGQTGKAVER